MNLLFGPALCLVGVALLNLAAGEQSKVYVVWGGARNSTTLDKDVTHDYLHFGVQYTAVKFKDVPSEDDNQWNPSDEGSKNLSLGNSYVDAACENTGAFQQATSAAAACGNCGSDYSIVENYGTLPKMNWKKDHVMLVSCQVVKQPQKCTNNPSSCTTDEVHVVGGSHVGEAVNYMHNKLGDPVQAITKPSSDIKDIKNQLYDYKAKSGDNIDLPPRREDGGGHNTSTGGGGGGKHSMGMNKRTLVWTGDLRKRELGRYYDDDDVSTWFKRTPQRPTVGNSMESMSNGRKGKPPS